MIFLNVKKNFYRNFLKKKKKTSIEIHFVPNFIHDNKNKIYCGLKKHFFNVSHERKKFFSSGKVLKSIHISKRVTRRLTSNYEARVALVINLQKDPQGDSHEANQQQRSLLKVFNKTNKVDYSCN